MKKQIMYADTVNGKFDQTYEEMLQQVRENPIFSEPNEVAFEGTDGVEYTGTDLLEIVGMKNEADDM